MTDQEDMYTKDSLINPRYSIGEYTYGVPHVHDWGDGGNLIIGKYTSIATDVHILLGGNHHLDWVTTYPFHSLSLEHDGVWPSAKSLHSDRWSKGDVIIGNDVWIGINVTILSGVTIGDGSAVAAGAIVTKNVEPYSIVAGNPARLLRKRFSDNDIKQLLILAWWNWTEEKVEEHIKNLQSDNIRAFVYKPKTYKKIIIRLKKVTPPMILRVMRKLRNGIRRE
jgi:acetyltransferase-like isoleucine patch superfamily enzyme